MDQTRGQAHDGSRLSYHMDQEKVGIPVRCAAGVEAQSDRKQHSERRIPSVSDHTVPWFCQDLQPSDPTVRSRSGDTSLAPDERGKHKRNSRSRCARLAVRAYKTNSIAAFAPQHQVRRSVCRSRCRMSSAIRPDNFNRLAERILCRPVRPSAATSTFTGAASAPANDVTGLQT